MRRSYDLLVLGAGPAGLAAAWRAARRGFSVGVIERTDHVGGIAASFDVAGIRVDQGSQRLQPTTPPHVLADLRDLLGNDLQTRMRNGRLRIGSRWVDLPMRPANLLRTLPTGLAASMTLDATTRTFRRGRPETYADEMRLHFGDAAYDAVYGPLAEKLWGRPGEAISVEQARVRANIGGVAGLAGRAIHRRDAKRYGRSYLYPRRGFGQLSDALAEAAVKEGATIAFDSEVSQVQVFEDRLIVTTQDGDHVEGKLAFSTLPLPMLARIARPAPSLAQLESAGRLRFRAVVLVYLEHEGGRWTPYDAHHLPSRVTPIARLSEPTNYRDNPDDPVDRSVVCAEIPCSMADDVWGMSDEALADLVEEGLAQSGLPRVRRGVVATRRLANAYPVYALGFEDQLAGIDRWARDLRRVVTLGRHGIFAQANTEHALVMAYDAIAAMRPDASFDRYAWTAARERFRTHVVRD